MKKETPTQVFSFKFYGNLRANASVLINLVFICMLNTHFLCHFFYKCLSVFDHFVGLVLKGSRQFTKIWLHSITMKIILTKWKREMKQQQ